MTNPDVTASDTPPSSGGRRELRATAKFFLSAAFVSATFFTLAVAQQSAPAAMRLTLDQAIELALKQNHSVRLRNLSVEQMQGKKQEARSNYMPQMTTNG